VNHATPAHAQLRALASYLSGRRSAILSAWRQAVESDPDLSTALTSTRSQFVDHIPAVLDAFESQLCALDFEQHTQARADEKESAADHGMHRWQQGYYLTETMREWGHLHRCLLDELEHYSAAHANLEQSVMPFARRALARLASDGVCASAARYAELQQSEAASRLHDLEIAAEQLRTLQIERAEAWREAAHDLRGRAHVIANASEVLQRDGIKEQKLAQAREALQIGVNSLNQLLTDLLDHARLEAGREERNLAEFDVASLLNEFCDGARPFAAERSLFLKAAGPAPLIIESDPVKVQRILQNLVLNGLQATRVGGVRVTWDVDADSVQWALCVQDTGPGFAKRAATPLKQVLKKASDEARAAAENAPPESSIQADAAGTLASGSQSHAGAPPAGEGIGLSIVKRLCELLDASLELETAEGRGSTFRVTFPCRYTDPVEDGDER
jgi:signal transduction histidine kinase